MKFNKQEALKQAQDLAHSFDEGQADNFATDHKDSNWYEDFVLLLDMFRDDSFRLDSKTYLSIAGALTYVIMPLDVIPDFLPVVGWIDDVFVMGVVIKSLSDEISRYKKHIKSIAA